MLWLFTTHYLIVKIKEIRVLFPNIRFRVRNQLPYVSVVRKRKTRPTSPLCPQTRNSAKESKDADMGHFEMFYVLSWDLDLAPGSAVQGEDQGWFSKHPSPVQDS